MLAVQSVPRGGDITISASTSGEMTTVALNATGPKSRLDAAIEAALNGKAPEDGFDGRTIQPFYTGLMAREMKGQITTSVEGDTISFAANLPISENA
jgi:histidine phosphotransferase ChpT